MEPTQDISREYARRIILRHGWNTMAYQVLNPGISLWFSKQREGVVGYVETPSHVVVAGSPISHENELTEITFEFYHFVSAINKKICFFGAQQRISNILSEYTPSSTIVLGAQPTWTPGEWIQLFYKKQSLRAQILRAQNKQVSVKIVREKIDQIRKDLERCLQEWIRSRPLPAMHFLVEPNTLEFLEDRILCIAEKDQQIVGFCIASPIPLRNGWLIEQIIRGVNAPNGTAELLLHSLIMELDSRKSEFITLGLSPLSKHYSSPKTEPAWLRVFLSLVRTYGKGFYNFNGLEQFKAKFQPSGWEPVYAITNEPKPSLSTLYAIATAFTVMPPIKFVGKGFIKHIEQILRG